jgi:hypothetical protein
MRPSKPRKIPYEGGTDRPVQLRDRSVHMRRAHFWAASQVDHVGDWSAAARAFYGLSKKYELGDSAKV